MYDIPVASSRVTHRRGNNTRFIVGEAEIIAKVDPQESDDITGDPKTKRNFTLPIDGVFTAVARARPGRDVVLNCLVPSIATSANGIRNRWVARYSGSRGS